MVSEEGYYLLIDATAFDNPAGSSYTGIADKTVLNWTIADTTSPTVTSVTSSTPDGTINI